MKKIILVCCYLFVCSTVLAQKDPPENWFNLDLKADGVPGVSSEKAYKKLLKRRKAQKTIIVAVIDSGIDILHEDLKDVIWTNKKEIEGNGIDDDGNGYIDDLHGWNFIGGSQENVIDDTYEVTRELKRLKDKYRGWSKDKIKADDEYAYYEKISKEVNESLDKKIKEYKNYEGLVKVFEKTNALIKAYLDVEEVTPSMLASINSEDKIIKEAVTLLQNMAEKNINESVVNDIKNYFEVAINKSYNTDFDPRYKVEDNYEDLDELGYGNNDVIGEHNMHGTHVSGIVAANRTNDIGIKGVADNVLIMALRAVPNGDERDKDVANAIIYAVDNGAHIINMSFGKGYSPDKAYVDKAIKYAEDKGVLLVHAAGNSNHNNNDRDENFPNPVFSDAHEANNWLEIGASTFKPDSLVADFSNFGDQSVDFFAPGFKIYSTVPGNGYEANSGTSMAAPVTSGVAALVLSRYPKIPAKDLRKILIDSTVLFEGIVTNKPGTEERTSLDKLARKGGVVNVYNALVLAKKYYKAHKLK